MSEPTYGSTTEDLWERLPDHFRRMDAQGDWAFKKYVNLIGAQLQKVDDLVERIDYDSVADGGEPGATSDLANPATADVSWLPWLGQLFGVRVRGKGQERDREEVIQAASGFNAGTPAAIEAAAKEELVGSKFAKVYRRSTPTGVGTFWDLLLVTIDSETLKNLYPELQATIASPNDWDVSIGGGWTPKKQIIKTDKNVYNNSALEVSFTGGTGNSNLFLNSNYKVTGITPTDWYQVMLTAWTETVTYSGQLKLYYYNASDAEIGSFTQSITVDPTPKQFLVGGVAPAGASYFKAEFNVITYIPSYKIYIAQLGARHEANDYWVPRTADPVRSVIEKGAKPAGFKLWYGGATSSWDDVLADNPTWADWEAAGSWTAIEETST